MPWAPHEAGVGRKKDRKVDRILGLCEDTSFESSDCDSISSRNALLLGASSDNDDDGSPSPSNSQSKVLLTLTGKRPSFRTTASGSYTTNSARTSISSTYFGGAHSVIVPLVYSFGRNIAGGLGHGHTKSCLLPTPVQALRNCLVATLTAGGSASLVVTVDTLELRLFALCMTKKRRYTEPALLLQIASYMSVRNLLSFGYGEYGQLGHGDVQTHTLPKSVSSLHRTCITKVSTSGEHTAVVVNGWVYTFGLGEDGQLGHGNLASRTEPTLVTTFETMHNVTHVAAAGKHTLFVAGSQLYACGMSQSGTNGPLGLPEPDFTYTSPTHVPLFESNTVTDLASSLDVSAVLADDELCIFGSFPYNGTTTEPGFEKWGKDSFDGSRIQSFGLGDAHIVVLTEHKNVYTFGRNHHGQLGIQPTAQDGTAAATRCTPIKITLPNAICKQISAGLYHTALSSGDSLHTFGGGGFGQLGHGSQADNFTSSEVTSLSGHHIIEVVCGGNNTFVLATVPDDPMAA
eukprot:TRINITY_DN67475_c6_g1_i3.p1 TRINITY_DN67475_c6_g1~~TRINITY_DN67475_c6_g1_i3.p1  ORF type:complete len:516 (-),score=20.04 TRINITY_DN67475_c6_g1_i3:445-1992(-)